MVVGSKSSLDCLGGANRHSRRGLFFRANVMNFQVRGPLLMEDRLNNVPVRPREHLAEHGAGDLYVKIVPVSAI